MDKTGAHYTEGFCFSSFLTDALGFGFLRSAKFLIPKALHFQNVAITSSSLLCPFGGYTFKIFLTVIVIGFQGKVNVIACVQSIIFFFLFQSIIFKSPLTKKEQTLWPRPFAV